MRDLLFPAFDGKAACVGEKADRWFPESHGPVTFAKKKCADCEIRIPCLSWAIANDERFGIWGGLTEDERKQLRRRRAS